METIARWGNLRVRARDRIQEPLRSLRGHTINKAVVEVDAADSAAEDEPLA